MMLIFVIPNDRFFRFHPAYKSVSSLIRHSTKIILIFVKNSEHEIDAVINVCKTLYSGNGRDGKEINVPTKNGGTVRISGCHAFTLVGYKDGFIEIRNPWNNQETFEISELYVPILFDVMAIANVN